jgi:hypothetical protein
MTTKILIVNLGPAPVRVRAHGGCACGRLDYQGTEQLVGPGDHASLLYVHAGQRITVTEELPPEVSDGSR